MRKMANKPLVSITIPSRNSEKTLPMCLSAIRKQTYPHIETLVIDSHSSDGTTAIAASYEAKVIQCDGKLLAARYLGVKEAKGQYIALIDTDQILKARTIERAVDLMNYYDMVVFEEHSFNTNWFIPKLYNASKKIVNARFDKDYAFDPVKGGNAARFFERDVLERAFANIPKELIPKIIHYNHDIIYYESYKVAPRVGILRDALYHIEPDFSKLWRTNLRYGASLRAVKESYYWDSFLGKRFCSGFWFGRPLSVGFQALLLTLILKTVQCIGYHFGHNA